MGILSVKATMGGSVKLIMAMLGKIVSLQQSNRKHMGISSDGHPSVQWGIGEAQRFAYGLLHTALMDEPPLPPTGHLEDHHYLFPYVCNGIAAMKQGLQA